MHRTYELYVRQPDGQVRFEALTHPGSDSEIMRHVQELLEATGARDVEVRRGGTYLFTLMGDAPAA
jgi:hypothetical protein